MIFSFHEFELDTGRRELRRGGELVGIQPKVLDLLITLVRQRGRFVSREEALETVWPGVFVSDHAFAQVLHKLRVALGDDRRRDRILETRRGLGVRFTAEVMERGAAGTLAPGDTDALRALGGEPGVLLERGAVLAQLGEVLRRALAGRQQFAMVSGEAGIGKTTLLGALAARALEVGFKVTLGRALPGSGAPAFAPWTRILGEILESWSPGEVEHALGPSAAYLTQAAPELLDILPSMPSVPALDPEHSRFRCFQAVASLLRAASKQCPLLILLEDMHWGDASSLLLVQFLTQHLRHTCIALALTFRGEEVAALPALEQTLAVLHRMPDVVEIGLEGLSRAAVARLLEHATGRSMSGALTDVLHRRTGGNPFFVTQYASLLDCERGAQEESEAYLERLVQALPSGVLAAAARRLAYVSPECHEVLRFASLLVGDADFELLARSSGLTADATLTALEEAARTGVLSELEGAPGHFRFQHELIRDALAAELSVVRRAEMHRMLGEAIEALHAGALAPHYSSLAYHYAEAAAVGAREPAVVFAELAGRRALESLRFEEAAQHFARALAVPDEGMPGPPERRVELLLARGEALIGAAEFAEAREVFWQAVELARAQGDARRLARAALGYATKPIWPDWRIPVPLLEEALGKLGAGDVDLRMRLELQLAQWLTFDPSARDRVVELLKSAEQHAQRTGDTEVRCDALLARCRTLDFWCSLNRRERLASADRALALAQEAHDDMRAMIALFRGLRPLLELGDFDAADARFARFAALSERLHFVDWSWQVPLYRAMRQEMSGRLDAAARELGALLLESRVESYLERPDTLRVPNVNALFFTLQRERGGEPLDLGRAVASFTQAPLVRAALALQLAESGQLDAARTLLERLADQDFSELASWPDSIATCAMWVQVCRVLHDPPHAAQLFELLLPHAGTWIFVMENAACGGPVDIQLGVAATLAGDLAAAARYLASGERQALEGGAPIWLARARFFHAEMLLARGGPGDRARAAALVDEAAAAAHELGLVPMLRWVEALRAADASRYDPPPARRDPGLGHA